MKNPSEMIKECLNECLAENESTEKITMLKWPKKLRMVTKMCKSPILLKEDFEDIAYRNNEK